MAYSTIAKNKETGKEVRLLLNTGQLTVIQNQEESTGDSQSSTVETKVIFDLEFVYGVDYNSKEDSLKINIIVQKQEDKKVNSSGDKKTLTNIRPQDIKWNLCVLHYVLHTPAAVEQEEEVVQQQDTTFTTLSSFATQLENLVLPHHDKLPNTSVFVVLNPTSGTRLAETQFKTIVKPMLVTAGFHESNITKIITANNGGTRTLADALGQRILKTTTENEPTPIVIAMGGDGTLHEVINGLKDATNTTGATANFRLGVIPAGSGNAFSLGLNIESVEQATVKIIKGLKEEPFYLIDVKFGHNNSNIGENWQNDIQYDVTKKPIRLLVVMSWGFHAQIVSKSRYLRYFMGNKRFSLVALFLLKFLQQYEGQLVLKNAKRYNPELQKFDDEQDVELDSTNDKGFTYFIVSKQHSLEKGFKIAPFASPLTNDMDVVVLRGANAETLTKASMEAFQGGAHVNLDHVEYFKAKDLLLRVKDNAELCLDGEIYDLPAQGILHLKVIGSSSTESTFTVFV